MGAQEKSKTFINTKGEIIFFGLQHFLDDIAKGDCCFICGAQSGSKDFNDEHVIPDWILQKYKLHNKFVTLPNKTKFRYGQYKIPCCVDCNSELGKNYEKPISRLLSKSYSEICDTINKEPQIIKLLFKWLSLIFLKTHIKDKTLLANRNPNIGTGYIADEYYWEEIHHIHCIARSHYTKAIIDDKVYGSVFILPSLKVDKLGGFDFIDSPNGKVIMIQLGEFSIISVLDDSCASVSLFNEHIQRIKGPLNPFQLREIISHLSFINLNLKENPVYSSSFSPNGNYKINAKLPEKIDLLDKKEQLFSPGQFLRYYVELIIGEVDDKEQILKEIEEGKRGYLFNKKGEFLTNNVDKKTTANN